MLTRGKGESSQNSSVGHRRCHNRDGSVGFHAQPLDGGSMILQHRLFSVSGGREKLRHFPKIVAQKICRSKKLPYLESSLSPDNFPLEKNDIPYHRTIDSFVKFLFKDTKMHEAGISLSDRRLRGNDNRRGDYRRKTRRVSVNVAERAAGGVRPFLTAHFLTPPRLTLGDVAEAEAEAAEAAAASSSSTAARTMVSSLRGKGGGARLPVIVRDLFTLARLSAY